MEVPMLARIRQVPRILPGVTEYYLRQLEAQGKLPGPYSGKTKLVNIPQLIELINVDSKAGMNTEGTEQCSRA